MKDKAIDYVINPLGTRKTQRMTAKLTARMVSSVQENDGCAAEKELCNTYVAYCEVCCAVHAEGVMRREQMR